MGLPLKLIIQIPCLNEEETLPATIAELPRSLDGFDSVEMLVIDDGSTDRTVEVARECGVEHIVRLTNNKGLAAGFQAGLDACLKLGADVVVNTDADNQYKGADVAKLVAPILAGEADMVVGNRQVDGIEHFSDTKKQLQHWGSWVVRRVSNTEVTDTTSGFRAYNREAALQLSVVDNFTYTLESLVQAGKMLVAVDEVPIGTNPQTRESRLAGSTGDYVRRNTPAILRIYARYEPLRAFVTAAIVVGVLAILAWLPFLIDAIFNGKSNGHIQSLILGAVLMIAAVQLFALGVIGDLLAGQRVMTQRVFERVRRVELALGVPPSHYEKGPRKPAASEEPRRSVGPRPMSTRERTLRTENAPRSGERPGTAGKAPASSADYGKTASFLAVGVGLTGRHHLRLLPDRLAHLSKPTTTGRSRCSGRRSSSPSPPSTGRSNSCSAATSPSGW